MKSRLLLLIFGFIFIGFACDNSENTNEVSANSTNTTNNNTTIESDTSKKENVTQSVEEKIATIVSETAKDLYEDWEKGDSIRDANEPHKWVYLIGDSYDDDDLAAQTYDKFKETESDIYIFKKKRKKFYLIKGMGLSSRKTLDDSLEGIQKRLNARIDVIDLSKACRKLPTNTDPIKYKIDGEKKYADCKKCE